MGDLKEKLIRVERSVNIYNRENELISAIDIDIPIDMLKEIVTSEKDDPELYDGYILDVNQLQRINTFLKQPIEINITENNYYLVAGGIYNW